MALIYVSINLSIIGVVPWREFVPATDPPAPVVSLLWRDLQSRSRHGFHSHGFVDGLWLGVRPVARIFANPLRRGSDGCFSKSFAAASAKEFSARLVGGDRPYLNHLRVSSALTVIDALLVTRILVQFIGQIFAVILLRRSARKWSAVPDVALPIACLVALAGWTFIFVTADKQLILYGLGTLAAGVLVFLVWSKWTERWPFANQADGRRKRTNNPVSCRCRERCSVPDDLVGSNKRRGKPKLRAQQPHDEGKPKSEAALPMIVKAPD